jgi:hypothetical protein
MDITTKKHMTDQDIVDHIIYAGADMYDWYVELSHDETNNDIRIVMEDPDFPENSLTVETNPGEIRAMISRIITEDLPGAKAINRAVLDDDFDSNDSDIVLQYMIFGQIVYA